MWYFVNNGDRKSAAIDQLCVKRTEAGLGIFDWEIVEHVDVIYFEKLEGFR